MNSAQRLQKQTLRALAAPKAGFIQLDRWDSAESFAKFFRLAWPVLEPDNPYVHGWHIDAIAEHLEAVSSGDITRSLINVPPGMSKSLSASVMWPAWEWGPKGKRSLRYLTTSFNETPVKRDTRKMRDLILSEWYQDRWPEVRLVRTGETSFANSDTGNREGVPFGSLTSQRGDRLIIDDPHSTKTAESPTERATTVRQFREGATNRLNDQARSAIVVIMQRLHEKDISGEILANDMGYTHLMLPMEYDPKPFIMSGKVFDPKVANDIGFVDPREQDGELLDPLRFSTSTVERLKLDQGSYGWAGQYQQRPSPRAGGLFKRHWFDNKVIQAAPEGTRWVRHWDLAATKKTTAARTAGVKMGKTPDGRFVVAHVITEQEEGDAVRRIIRATAQADGLAVEVSLPQDPGQAGKVQKSDLIAMLAGFTAHAEPETGDKEDRARPFAAQCEAGNVSLIVGSWNQDYIDELASFPTGRFKDQVDASSGAFGRLIRRVSSPAGSGIQIVRY